MQAGRVEPITRGTVLRDLYGWWRDGQKRSPATSATSAGCRSGRWQARYLGPDGGVAQRRTFETKRDAEQLARASPRHEMTAESGPTRSAGRVPLGDVRRAVDPRAAGAASAHGGAVPMAARQAHRAARSAAVELGEITTALVRRWRAELLAAGVSQSMAAKCVPTAAGGPQHRRRGGRAHPAEPVPGAWRRPGEPGGAADADVAQVFELADGCPPRYRVLGPRRRRSVAPVGRGDRAPPLRRRRGRELGTGEHRAHRGDRARASSSALPSRAPACGPSSFPTLSGRTS